MKTPAPFLLSLILIFNSTACFRVTVPQTPKDELVNLGLDPFRNNREKACSYAISSLEDHSPHKSPESIFLAAQCYEYGALHTTGDVKQDKIRSDELYTLAAQCHLLDAERKLTRLGLALPERTTSPGPYFWPYFRLRAEMCGYEDEITTVGVAALRVSSPVIVAGAIVTTVLLVGVGLPLCVIYAVATKGRCM